MIKTVTLLKRRPDIDRAEFVRRYETSHAKLGERLLRGGAVRYFRRYLDPLPGYAADAQDADHDVLMEIWYPDQAAFDATMARLTTPETQAEIIADEETLFDRSRSRFFVVDEHESEMG